MEFYVVIVICISVFFINFIIIIRKGIKKFFFLVCLRGKFGLDCFKDCKCREELIENCDYVIGVCICLEGWIGDECERSKYCVKKIF